MAERKQELQLATSVQHLVRYTNLSWRVLLILRCRIFYAITHVSDGNTDMITLDRVTGIAFTAHEKT